MTDVNVLDAIRTLAASVAVGSDFTRECTSIAMKKNNYFDYSNVGFVMFEFVAGSVCYVASVRSEMYAEAGRCAKSDCGHWCSRDTLCPPLAACVNVNP